MKEILARVPVIAILFLLLGCVHFVYRGSTWEVFSPGLPGGLCVLAVIGVVLLFRIHGALKSACLAHGIQPSQYRSKYDLLIPVGIVAVAVHIRYVGDPRPGPLGKSGYRWEFEWSNPQLAVPFLAALFGVVLLVRVLYLVRAIAEIGERRN